MSFVSYDGALRGFQLTHRIRLPRVVCRGDIRDDGTKVADKDAVPEQAEAGPITEKPGISDVDKGMKGVLLSDSPVAFRTCTEVSPIPHCYHSG